MSTDLHGPGLGTKIRLSGIERPQMSTDLHGAGLGAKIRLSGIGADAAATTGLESQDIGKNEKRSWYVAPSPYHDLYPETG